MRKVTLQIVALAYLLGRYQDHQSGCLGHYIATLLHLDSASAVTDALAPLADAHLIAREKIGGYWYWSIPSDGHREAVIEWIRQTTAQPAPQEAEHE